MGLVKNFIPGPIRIMNAQRDLRRTKGKPDAEIQAAVDTAVREGSSMEMTSRTLQHMGLSEAKVAQFMQAGYPYPSPPAP